MWCKLNRIKIKIAIFYLVGEKKDSYSEVEETISSIRFEAKIYSCIQGNSRKGSGDVVSAVCYIMYTIYQSLCTQTADSTSPEPFSQIPLWPIFFNVQPLLYISDFNLEKWFSDDGYLKRDVRSLLHI